jgi:transcriptional regulator with XRE-family HTH domain
VAGRRPRELTPHVSPDHELGAELRGWRDARGLSQRRLGELTHHSATLISKIENAERRASSGFCAIADEVLETQGSLTRMWEASASDPSDSQILASCLLWAKDSESAIKSVCQLWNIEMNHRSPLNSVSWVVDAFISPMRAWQADFSGLIRIRKGRKIGRVEIDSLWAMCDSFTDADRRLGGGYARSTLIYYVNTVVRPILLGADYSEATGQELMAVAARLSNLCAFMSFDAGKQGLAQRYFILALRLAHISGNRALGAHILGDMSMQAHYLGKPGLALELATAGYDAGVKCGSPGTASRCAALQGRAYALRGNAAEAARSRLRAEHLVTVKAPDGEPSWIRFFTVDQLAAEAQYIAADLGQHKEVQRLGTMILASSEDMLRRKFLVGAMLAKSYILGAHAGRDVDRATEILGDLLSELSAMTSARSHRHFSDAQQALVPYGKVPGVRDFNAQYKHVSRDWNSDGRSFQCP